MWNRDAESARSERQVMPWLYELVFAIVYRTIDNAFATTAHAPYHVTYA